jgi:hypothetical protein
VLKLAKIHDMPWSPALTLYAAVFNKLELLRWLRSVKCPWDEDSVLQNAACRGSTALLDWAKSQVDAAVLADNVANMLTNAATYDNLGAVQWLQQHAAAEWPDSFCHVEYERQDDGTEVVTYVCWSKRAVQWALANGCTWGDWRCSLFTAERYTQHLYARRAAELFLWAHDNDCPCTVSKKLLMLLKRLHLAAVAVMVTLATVVAWCSSSSGSSTSSNSSINSSDGDEE